MFKAFLRILLFLLALTPCFAQEGNYPLTHFPTPGELNDFYPHQIIQDRHGMVFMAYNRGIIRFDGDEWEQIQTPASVFTLAYYGGKIYTGGPSGFGLLERGSERTWQYVPLHAQDSTTSITQMIIHKGRLVGLSEQALVLLDLKDRSYQKIKYQGTQVLEKIHVFENELFVATNFSAPLKLSGDSLLSEATIARDLSSFDFVEKSRTRDLYIAGSAHSEPVLLDKSCRRIPWQEADNEDLQYLRESEITQAAWVGDTLVALASLKGGVIFIQPFKGRITKIVNASSGLPDNEVISLSVDRNKAVWVAHEYGLTRISPFMPYRTFDQFPGIEGKILSVKRHLGGMYVGTTEGLFKLTRVEETRKIPVRSAPVASSATDDKGFWKKIWPFRKKGDQVRTTFRLELQSVSHQFQKVEGLESKVFHLTSHNEKLYASGLDGLYLIEDNKSQQLTSLPIRYAHYSPWRDRLYLTSYTGEVYMMDPSVHGSQKRIMQQQGEPVSYMFEDARGNLYFCGVNTLYQMERGDIWRAREVSKMKNPYYDETFGYVRGDSVIFLHKTTGDISNSMIATLHGQPVESPDKEIIDVIPGENGSIWALKGVQWKQLGKDNQAVVPDLSIFKNATYISDDPEKKGMWIITGNNSLFFLENVPSHEWALPNSPYLYEVQAGTDLIKPGDDIVIDQEVGNVNFQFSQAEFTQLIDMEYQYYVEGLDESWSDWSTNNRSIALSYLPAGKYTLHFRSRNSLGQMETVAPVYFKILAPYWKRPWFYLVEFAFIGLMLLISVRMKAMGYKYRLISRLLALLTLVIIIELIQILAESKFETETSPVVDFVIQVVIAITILPVEEILRKYIFKDKHVKVSDLFALKERRRRNRRKVNIESLSDASVPVQK